MGISILGLLCSNNLSLEPKEGYSEETQMLSILDILKILVAWEVIWM